MFWSRAKYPYECFFHVFDELGTHPTYAEIMKAYPTGERQEYAFKHFMDLYPSEVPYLLGYLQSREKNGIYDQRDYDEALSLVARGLKLSDVDGAHVKLRQFGIWLIGREESVREEEGGLAKGAIPEDSPEGEFRCGDFEALEQRFLRSRDSVKPVGIMGGPDEREYWLLFQYMIRIPFRRRKPKTGMKEMDRYQDARISVHLTPIPSFDIQKTVIGYLAQTSLPRAISRLRFWIANSKTPIITEVIKDHPAFSHLFYR